MSLSSEYNGVSPEQTGLSLGEAWMDWNAGGFQLRLGRQLVSWGAADGLVLTNVACPQNLTAYAELDFAPDYERTIMAGADASVPLGEFLLRLEAAWTGGGRYDRLPEETAAALSAGRSDEPVEKHNLKLLAGLDWNPSGWSLSAQYYEDLLPEAYSDGGGIERPWQKYALTLRIGRSFFREILSLSAWCYLDLRDFDAAAGTSAAWALTDSLRLSLVSDVFTGGVENRGNYAAYRDLSCLWVKGGFRF